MPAPSFNLNNNRREATRTMETTTPNLLTDYQTKRLAKLDEMLERAFKILSGGRALGLEMLDLDVIGGFREWGDPNDPGSSVVAYAHHDFETMASASSEGFVSTGPVFTVIRRDEDHEAIERLLLTVGLHLEYSRKFIKVLDRTEAEVLSPADTALELTEEDVAPLERVRKMYTVIHVPAEYCEEAGGGTLTFLNGILGERIPNHGHGIERDGTLYLLAGDCADVMAIRPDGTILPVGRSLGDPNEKLDGEREAIIRPRIEELRN
jgi:hypothetical protein